SGLTVDTTSGALAGAIGSGLTAHLVSGPLYGTLTLNPDGSFTYTPATNFAGFDSFIFMAQDGTGTMSNLAMLTITVRGNTTTTVSSSAAAAVYGQSFTFTATVAPASATGTVQFKVDGNDFGTKNLSDGSATSDATSTLTVGDHTITAIYSGDDNFVGSTSSSFTQTVTTRQTTTTVALSPSAVVVGQASTVTVTVKDTEAAGGGPFTPTGTVGITLGVGSDSVSGTCTLAESVLGTATCQVTVTPTTQPGTHTVTATFA